MYLNVVAITIFAAIFKVELIRNPYNIPETRVDLIFEL